MFVEDIINDLAHRIAAADKDPVGAALREDPWTQKFVESLQGSVKSGRALSTEQGRVFLNVLRRLKRQCGGPVSGMSAELLDQFLLAPRFRNPPYQSTPVKKEVRYLGDNKLGFRCKRSDEIMHDIKAMSNRGRDSTWKEQHRPYFNRQHKLWVISITADTYQSVVKLIGSHGFDADDAVIEYLALADSSRGQASTFVLDDTTGSIVVNICDNPVLESWVKRVIFGEIL
jgi:hypothetical protein